MQDYQAPSRPRSKLYPARKRDSLGIPGYMKEPGPLNRQAHRDAHSPSIIVYTSMVPLTTDTGTDWNPPFAGNVVGIAINVKSGDEPASTATIYDLTLNGISVFASDNERPTIYPTKQHSAIYPVLRGAFLQGDAWVLQCKQTGGVNKVIVQLLLHKDG